LSGKAPVDPHFTRHSQGTVVEHSGKIYAATLNQTNVAHNNNKFYILQIIQVSPREYYFFCRWGRVGVVGQTSEMLTTDLNIAIREYETKLRQKTKSGSYRIV
jgi:poly [ADP-ribose] polymerase